jgi:hypothetical protein
MEQEMTADIIEEFAEFLAGTPYDPLSSDYTDGYHDAAEGEPLFYDSSAEYRACWLAWWRFRRAAETLLVVLEAEILQP